MAEYVDWARKIEATKHRIDESPRVSDHNRAIIYRFLRFMEAEGLSPARIDRVLDLTRIYAESLHPKKLDKVTKEDIVELCASWEKAKNAKTGQPWTANTLSTYKQVLKKFYRWLLGRNNEQTDWVSSTVKQVDAKVINPNDMFSEDDIKKLIDTADEIRDKAFVACLFDSACRPEEFITLQISDVVIDNSNVKLRIRRGKTGQRFVHLTVFPSYLTAWLNVHPLKDDAHAPLWVTTNNNGRNQPLTYAAARNFFRELCFKTFYPDKWKKLVKDSGLRRKRDGVKLDGRRFSLYNLRHSRATQLVKLGVSVSILQRHLGHSKINRTMVYTHLNDKDVENGLRQAMGGAIEEEVKPESTLRPRACARCAFINDATVDFCGKCAAPLTLAVAQRMQDQQQEAILAAVDARFKELEIPREEWAATLKAKIARKEGKA